MKRFGIRNYGTTRQVPYKNKQINIIHDGVIETDDEELVTFLGKQENFYITDSGVELVPMVAPVVDEPKVDEVAETPEDEISYDDMNVPELKVLAKDRQLDIKGLKKAEIIEALQDYDSEDVPEVVSASVEKEIAETA